MSPRPLIIVGAGGFGREVISIVRAINDQVDGWQLVGVADDDPSQRTLELLALSGTTFLGSVVAAVQEGPPDVEVVVAVGDPTVRSRIVARLPGATAYPTLLHPASTRGHGGRTSHGCVIAAGARLSVDITLGEHVHVDQNAVVGHDVNIGPFSRLSPMACVSGGVQLGRGVYLGASSTVLQGLTVGDGAIVGAGAVVVHDVPAGRTVKGVPAR